MILTSFRLAYQFKDEVVSLMDRLHPFLCMKSAKAKKVKKVILPRTIPIGHSISNVSNEVDAATSNANLLENGGDLKPLNRGIPKNSSFLIPILD
ncbi:hypothetical protein SLEP1_g18924 [Rubroshorea leprosula]|uniref:Uncharacterized protein n=1 Tax=Rubroshorea leprosula TaxID=152421 RepID=A0AAV5J822_9ROSI|nr:hypothetical protein SLEP1_g18924 [Rubroshorea leprosula]